MHKPRILLAVGACILVSSLVVLARQTILQSTVQVQSAPALLQDSLTRRGGTAGLSDISMSGTVQRIAGSDNQSGSVALKVLSSGATRLDFGFPSGPRSEFKSFGTNGPIGAGLARTAPPTQSCTTISSMNGAGFPLFAVEAWVRV
jgi:hypothetical protein